MKHLLRMLNPIELFIIEMVPGLESQELNNSIVVVVAMAVV